MRSVLLLALAGLVACGDPGLRDRSLASRTQGGLLLRAKARKATPLYNGAVSLVPDTLSIYYPEDADVVLRFSELNALTRELRPQLDALQRALPVMRIPPDGPAVVLRRALELPDAVVLDPVRPFALAHTPRGWVGILPTRSVDEGGGRLKQLDAFYCAAGAPDAVARYGCAFRKNTYLPGDVSILAAPATWAELGKHVAALVGRKGWTQFAIPDLPKDVGRLDVAFTLREGALRAEFRAETTEGTPAAHFVGRLPAARADLVRFLPPGGSVYAELRGSLADARGLVDNLLLGSSGVDRTLPKEIAEPLDAFLRARAVRGPPRGARRRPERGRRARRRAGRPRCPERRSR
jgi:hypothetical protein